MHDIQEPRQIGFVQRFICRYVFQNKAKCIKQQLLDEAFVISGIIKVSVNVMSLGL